MKVYVCPECNDVIKDGELRGCYPDCETCARRVDRSDLVEMEVNEGNAQHHPGTQPFEPGQLNLVKGAPNNKLTPRRHSPNRIRLIGSAHYEKIDLSAINIYPISAIVVPSNDRYSFIFGIIWLVFCFVMLSGFLSSEGFTSRIAAEKSIPIILIIFPILFFGIGIFVLCYGIYVRFYKAWIAYDKNYVYCATGIRMNPQKFYGFIRNPEDTEVVQGNGPVLKGGQTYNIVLRDAEKQITLAKRLFESQAKDYVTMLNSLLQAKFENDIQ